MARSTVSARSGNPAHARGDGTLRSPSVEPDVRGPGEALRRYGDAMAIYDHDISSLDGTPNALADLDGKVTLVVNVASKCGLTPQYTQLEQIHEQYESKGFSVLGVPCNQFLEQEPGSADEIQTFCSTTYGVTFPLTEKVDVNGDDRHPLFAELEETADDEGHTGDIRWNFEKFLVGGDGQVLARFAPTVVPDDPSIISAIEVALG